MGHSGIDKPLKFDDTLDDQDLDQPSFNSNSSFSSIINPLTSTPINARQHSKNWADIAETSSPLTPSFSLIDDSSSSDSCDQIRDSCQDHDSRDTMFTSHDDEPHPSPDDQECLQPTCHGIKLVGDNIDQTVNPTHTCSDHQSKTLNYFQMYAIKDGTDISNFSDEQPLVNPNAPLQELLPNEEDDCNLLSIFSILISRVLVKHVPFFSKHFSDVVVEHIPHIYSSEMSKKLTVVSSLIVTNDVMI